MLRLFQVLLVLVATGATVLYWAMSDRPVTPKPVERLVIGLSGIGDLSTLDPARAGTAAPIVVVWQIYERLVDILPDGSLVAGIASEWRASKDHKIWRFRIRQGVRFHGPGGRDVTPYDVKASIERALKVPGYGRTLLAGLVVGVEEFLENKVATVSGIRIEGDEVVFNLQKAFAFLPGRLAASVFSVVPKDTPLDLQEPPPGSGAYRVTAWNRAKNRVTVELFPQYWGEVRDAPRSLTFITFETDAVAILELRAGTLQRLETRVTALPLVRPLSKEGFRITLPPQTDIKLIALNQRVPPFKGEQGRILGRALNMAVDREMLVRVLQGGVPVNGPIPGYHTGPSRFPQGPERVKELIARAGIGDAPLRLLVLPGAENRLLAEAVTHQWRRAGLRIELVQGQADFFDRLVKGDYQMALAYYGPFLPVPEQYLWPYRRQSQPIPNAMGYENSEFEQAFDTYTSGGKGSEAALAEAVRILLDAPPVVWLVRVPTVVAELVPLDVPRVGSISVFKDARTIIK